MGKALYRTHRSRSLDEIVGQEHITDTLKSALKKGAISHAYLFTGPRGVGKTSIARILAHEINKIDYDDESIHLDIIEIDAASNRRIDEIRDLRDKVHIAPTSAKYKVYIIDEVHMLTREAFNALLKTLEEPPEHAVFILATTEAHKVPDTIISRTQRFIFKPIAEDTAVQHLKNIANKEKIAVSDEALELIAEHSGGSFRDSISMLDQLSGLGADKIESGEVVLLLGLPDTKVLNSTIASVVNNDPQKLFENIRRLKEQGVGAAKASTAISSSLRNDIVNGEGKLEHKKTIKLLRDILPLTMGSGDLLSLELALLDAMDIDTTNTAVSKQPTNDPAPELKDKSNSTLPKATDANSETEISDIVESSQPSQRVEKPEKAADRQTDANGELDMPLRDSVITENNENINTEFSTEKWNELLKDIKNKHNTLYGVLRMARPSHDGEQVLIAFNFKFHKNRVDESANNATIREYIAKYFGSPKFSALIEEKQKPTKKISKVTTNVQDEAVKSVSSIFNGAQLLES